MVNRIARFALVTLLLFLGATTAVGAVAVVPALPLEWLAGSPFANYSVPALALGLIGIGAFVSAGLLVFGDSRGTLLAMLVGAAIMVFEVVETLVVGLDVWLYALRLGPPPGATSPAADAAAVGTLAGIPIPLWLQPFYFVLGLVLVGLAWRLWRGVGASASTRNRGRLSGRRARVDTWR